MQLRERPSIKRPKSLHLVAAVGFFATLKQQSPLETVYVDNEIKKNVQGTRDGAEHVVGPERKTKCWGVDEDDDERQEMLRNEINEVSGQRSGGSSEERRSWLRNGQKGRQIMSHMRLMIGQMEIMRRQLERAEARMEGTRVANSLKLTKLLQSKDIEAYLKMFERMLEAYNVEEARSRFKLAPQLSGKVQQAYALLSADQAAQYPVVRKAI